MMQLRSLFLSLSSAATAFAISSELQNILQNTDKSNAYTYPTDLTRGIIPVPVHSHNDYWRDIPFYTALSNGLVSVEGDVWLYNGTLYVGHDESSLTTERTLDSLYIQPILSVLKKMNPTSPFVTSPTRNGVFDTSPTQTLYLWIDIKTDGEETWPYVLQALQPLVDGGWLTTVNGTAKTTGAVTVIGTGNTPLDQIQNVTDRYYFYVCICVPLDICSRTDADKCRPQDAPLALLNTTTYEVVTPLISPIASTDFAAVFGTINGTEFNSTQLATLREQIAYAKEKGIGVRYWDTPAWPISTRDAVWKTLVSEGVALLNADDVAAAAGQTHDW